MEADNFSSGIIVGATGAKTTRSLMLTTRKKHMFVSRFSWFVVWLLVLVKSSISNMLIASSPGNVQNKTTVRVPIQTRNSDLSMIRQSKTPC